MTTIDTRPETVDINHYAGDTLQLTITVPAGFADGLEWSSQIRATRDSATVDATFTIAATADPNKWTLTLPAATTRILAQGGQVLKTTRAIIQRYSGEWDVQVSGVGGIDPVTTLAQGTITIDLDVTKE